MKKFGGIPRKRKTVVKTEMVFDCKCPVCLGQVPGQEKIVKKLIDLHKKLNPTPSGWKKQAGLWSRIVDLTMELYIGHPSDKDFVKKAMVTMKQFAVENKFVVIQSAYKALEIGLTLWSSECSSSKATEKREIDCLKIIGKGL